MKTNSGLICSKFSVLPLFLATVLFSCGKTPDADFEATNTSPLVGETITLRDRSSNEPDTWDWQFSPGNIDFLDGTSSGSRDPVLKFNEAGSYSVSLTSSNQSGSDTENKDNYITVLNDHSQVVSVYSPGLENNLLGDGPHREVRMYLPPDYFENSSKRYPVIYLLHGFVADHNSWFEGLGTVLVIDIKEMLDNLIKEGTIEPMIVAAPNANNKFHGSKYTNSSTSGLWEDFITQDLVSYVDSHYRTISSRESRGIGGLSMGGMGALKIAMKNPELFSVVYSNSGGILDFKSVYLGSRKQSLTEAPQYDPITRTQIMAEGGYAELASAQACAPAYAPNPDAPPFYGDFPLTAEGELIDSTWQRWLEHDPLSMLPNHKDNLNRMTGILLDWGSNDEMGPSNANFKSRMSALGINHSYEIFDGGHTDRVADRFSNAGFPFFSQHLVHQ